MSVSEQMTITVCEVYAQWPVHAGYYNIIIAVRSLDRSVVRVGVDQVWGSGQQWGCLKGDC